MMRVMLDHHPAIRMADQGPVLFNSKFSHCFTYLRRLHAAMFSARAYLRPRLVFQRSARLWPPLGGL
jgi:hypothetical protein